MTHLDLNSLPPHLSYEAASTILRATIAVTGWLCMTWRLSGCATDARATGGTKASGQISTGDGVACVSVAYSGLAESPGAIDA